MLSRLTGPEAELDRVSGGYSYGVFILYGFVIQQCVATFGEPVRHWSLNILISLPISFGAAFIRLWRRAPETI